MSGEARGLAPQGELDASERLLLLRVAREALSSQLDGREPARPKATARLAAQGAVFVTLRRKADGELRGCIGQLDAAGPLIEAVAEMAVAAGTRDGRFAPVTRGELDSLRIEISVLSPLSPIDPRQVEPGRHGLLVRHQERRGVLLPQVPVEHGWDRERFLAQTCRKAGLPEDSWSRPDVELLGFTATVFGEDA